MKNVNASSELYKVSLVDGRYAVVRGTVVNCFCRSSAEAELLARSLNEDMEKDPNHHSQQKSAKINLKT